MNENIEKKLVVIYFISHACKIGVRECFGDSIAIKMVWT